MAYTRGDTYIWSDGDHVHLWDAAGLDHWRESGWYEGKATASGVQIAERVADEFAVMRFAELLEGGHAADAIERALSHWRGNGGCGALEQLAPRLRQLVSEHDL